MSTQYFDTLVIGGGIAGLQAAVDIADKGYKVLLIEKEASVGGKMIQLSKVFPTLDCSSCITTPKMNSAMTHENITVWELATLKQYKKIHEAEFEVEIERKTRYVTDACTACGNCEDVCPVEVPSEFEMGLAPRRAIYIPFQTAQPKKAVLDLEHCIACGKCYSVCPAHSIDYTLEDKVYSIKVASIVMSTGFELTPLGEKQEYNAEKFPNVISSMAMERILAPNGPFQGIRRPSDGSIPGNIAFIQCVGSRDASLNRTYCSRVCCMYAIKQAMLILGALPIVNVTIYYMDIRAFGKGYEQFYETAKAMGVEFVKAKVAKIEENKETEGNLDLYIEEISEYGGKRIVDHDMVVLSLGLTSHVCSTANIPVTVNTEDKFIESIDIKFNPVFTSIDGVFACGTAIGPKDIVDTIVEASATASKVGSYLKKYTKDKRIDVKEQEVPLLVEN
jgi:heterodisulfide reductase subunit A